MGNSYTISHEGQITYIDVHGTVTEEILKDIVKEIWKGKDYEHPCILWDFRSCIAGCSPEELRELGHLVIETKEERGYGRVAFVVEKYLHFELSKMFESYVEDKLPFEVKAFKNIEAAKKWLKDSGY